MLIFLLTLLILSLVLLGVLIAIRILIPLGLAIFVPSPTLAVKMMIYLAKVKPGEKAVLIFSAQCVENYTSPNRKEAE